MAYDFSQLTKEQKAELEEALEFLEVANHPTRGAKNRALIEQMGGIDPDKARQVAAYRTFKFDLKPDAVNEKLLVKHGVPQSEIERIKTARESEWRKDRESIYNMYTKANYLPQQPLTPAVEMDPVVIKPSPMPKVPRQPAMRMPVDRVQPSAPTPAPTEMNLNEGMTFTASPQAMPAQPAQPDPKNMTPQQAKDMLANMGLTPEQAMALSQNPQNQGVAPLKNTIQPVMTVGGNPVR